MKTTRPNSARRALISFAFSLIALQPALAQTADNAGVVGDIVGNLPTCRAMLTNCLNFSQRAQEAAGPDGTIDPNITPSACYDMYHQANHSGTWPDNQPLGFAMDCATNHEHHHRHHVFQNPDGNADSTPIADPAATPPAPAAPAAPADPAAPAAPTDPAANPPAATDPTTAQAADGTTN